MATSFLSIIIVLSLIQSANSIKTVTVDENNLNSNGATITKYSGAYDCQNSRCWALYADDAGNKDFHLKLSLNESWGFHPSCTSRLTIQISYNENTNWNQGRKLVVAFSQSGSNKYFATRLHIEEEQDHGIYPIYDLYAPYTAQYAAGDPESIVSTYTLSYGRFAKLFGYNYYFLYSPNRDKLERNVTSPSTFTLENIPNIGMLYTYTNPGETARSMGYAEMDPDIGMDVYLAMDKNYDSYDSLNIEEITVELEHDYPTISPTMEPTSEPSIIPTTSPSILPTTATPTTEPTKNPSDFPTNNPLSANPSILPTSTPTNRPTEQNLIVAEATRKRSGSISTEISTSKNIGDTEISENNQHVNRLNNMDEIELDLFIAMFVAIIILCCCICGLAFCIRCKLRRRNIKKNNKVDTVTKGYSVDPKVVQSSRLSVVSQSPCIMMSRYISTTGQATSVILASPPSVEPYFANESMPAQPHFSHVSTSNALPLVDNITITAGNDHEANHDADTGDSGDIEGTDEDVTKSQSTLDDKVVVLTPFGNDIEDDGKYDEYYDNIGNSGDSRMNQKLVSFYNEQGILPIMSFGSLPEQRNIGNDVEKQDIIDEQDDDVISQGVTLGEDEEIINIADDEFIVKGDDENTPDAPKNDDDQNEKTEKNINNDIYKQ